MFRKYYNLSFKITAIICLLTFQCSFLESAPEKREQNGNTKRLQDKRPESVKKKQERYDDITPLIRSSEDPVSKNGNGKISLNLENEEMNSGENCFKIKNPLGKSRESNTKIKIEDDQLKKSFRNKLQNATETLNDPHNESILKNGSKRKAMKKIKEVQELLGLNGKVNQFIKYAAKKIDLKIDLDDLVDIMLRISNFFTPAKIKLPIEVDESVRWNVCKMKMETRAIVNEVFLEGMNTLQRDMEKKSQIDVERMELAKFRVHLQVRNPELSIGDYLLKLLGCTWGKGSINVIVFKLAFTLELNMNLARRTCDDFLKGNIKITKIKDIKFEVKGGSSIANGLKRMMLNLITFGVSEILKHMRKDIEDEVQRIIGILLKDINPYCEPENDVDNSTD